MIECGKIVNTHGVRGELKVRSYCDEGFFKKIRFVCVQGEKYKVLSSRENNGIVLLKLENVNDMTAAERLKGFVMTAEREDIDIPENTYFYSELYGAEVFDIRKNAVVGVLSSTEESPAAVLLLIKTEKGSLLLPDVPAFVREKSPKKIIIETIEGFYPDEN